ncbi:hypothetical protein EXIGLDRAFT_698680 [Exidia glandulosa HHB12029]|uniref:Secreted protein n=1 Tax=Exidia glandulosa HHB12029 TaxID=1314781 RepID=A0A165E6E8_EXIGL|nr:hypothetical protein EXIGLDRAFT_698680 [Exidia glandulosa HHB12029]
MLARIALLALSIVATLAVDQATYDALVYHYQYAAAAYAATYDALVYHYQYAAAAYAGTCAHPNGQTLVSTPESPPEPGPQSPSPAEPDAGLVRAEGSGLVAGEPEPEA